MQNKIPEEILRIQFATRRSQPQDIVQSVFSLASPQLGRVAPESLTGDAELKMDWTEPPTELNPMGIYS